MPAPAAISFTLNGKAVDLAVDPATPLLWALRDHLNLTGTKYGCGIAACGACTVVVDGQAQRSCVTPLEAVSGLKVTTIEGLAAGGRLHALQQAWIEHQVPQCGYCQSGMLMAALGLLNAVPNPSDAQIDAAIDNICRCGTYPRVRLAIHSAAGVSAPRS
jgi:isoquinoline 1-oxidoreductase alpha subunit